MNYLDRLELLTEMLAKAQKANRKAQEAYYDGSGDGGFMDQSEYWNDIEEGLERMIVEVREDLEDF